MTERVTPMMDQYLRLKSQHADAILLFRMGDFYEMFFDDAKEAARILGLTLTTRGRHRGQPIPMAGVPWHSVDGYLRRLIEAGCRVAVCEQVEDPKKAKGIVRREVTEVITPGTLLADDSEDGPENRFIAAVVPGSQRSGLALADLSTGSLEVGEFGPDAITDELLRYRPAEIVVPSGETFSPPPELDAIVSWAEEGWAFTRERAVETLTRHLGTLDLDGFGCQDLVEGLGAAGGLLRYLLALKGDALGHFTRIRRLNPVDELFLDSASLEHLEVLDAPRGGRSLRQTLGETVTAMGSRFLRQALARPLRRAAPIRARQDAVARFVDDGAFLRRITETLDEAYDLERLAGRLGARRATPRDLAALGRTLDLLPDLRAAISAESGRLGDLAGGIHLLDAVRAELGRALSDEPPPQPGTGTVFREGYSAPLDEARAAARDGRKWIADLQATERERTGIANLKVGFNKVFGYYLEVTRANLKHVPEDYQRKQTLVGAERYVTETLKEMEGRILGAEERQSELEIELFEALRESVAGHVAELSETARSLAELDFLRGLAQVAITRSYCRPEVHEGPELRIRNGRHPVVEAQLAEGQFIPNDCEIHPEHHQILLVTGPNMAGKSTYLRQIGLIVIMAQIGSFVPAEGAVIGMADRVFTRVGASDNIARGQSTFLVEMHESANILHNATSQSLVLLDEVGRGTSTFDGLSIAWAMTEHLHDGMSGHPRTLFATHFHELTRLADRLPRVANFRVEVREWGDQVVFLRKIVEGRADRSYGIHVAQMAGLPDAVIARAREILADLEAGGMSEVPTVGRAIQTTLPLSPPVAEPSPSIVEKRLSEADLDNMTPIQALSFLNGLRADMKPED